MSMPRFLRHPDAVILFLIFTVSAAAHLCLFLAYPHGFPFPDSYTYLLSAQQFLRWKPVWIDWIRTPALGLILVLGQGTTHPGLPLFLLCAALHTASTALFYLLLQRLFLSRRIAGLTIIAFLLFEWTYFRTGFAETWMLTDALYANLMFFSALCLFFVFVTKRWHGFLILGSALFGIAYTVRLGSFPIFFVWLPVMLVVARSVRLRISSSVLCVALFFAPCAAWTFHQWSLYGIVGVQAFGERSLLARTMDLIQPGDVIFADPVLNAAFVDGTLAVHHLEMNMMEMYLWRHGSKDNPIDSLRFLTEDGRLPEASGGVRSYIRWNFQMRPIEVSAALRILSLHPGTYLRHFFVRYLRLFNPLQDPFQVVIPFYPPEQEYRRLLPNLTRETRLLFLPPNGRVDTGRYDQAFLNLFPATHVYPVITPFMQRHLFFPAAAWHALFALFLSTAYIVRKKLSPSQRTAAWCVALFFLNAILHYALAAAVQEPYERYSVMGELSLNAALLLSLLTAVTFLRRNSRV